MPARIVTSTYRYKRPPRKKTPVLLEEPALTQGGDHKSKSADASLIETKRAPRPSA